MIRFTYTGPMPVGFDSIGREVAPDEDFDVPDELALSFANHGHCRPADADGEAAVQALRDAEEQAAAAQQEARFAAAAEHDLVDAHPLATPPPAPRPSAPAVAAPRGRTPKTAAADENVPAAAEQ